MINSFLLYLAETTACLGVFSLAYRLVFSRLTHFQWNRFYLVGTVLLSAIIPMIAQPTMGSPLWLLFDTAIPGSGISSSTSDAVVLFPNNASLSQPKTTPTTFSYEWVAYCLFGIYSLGFLYKAYRFWQNILSVQRLIKANSPVQQGRYRLVYTQEDLPTFSFLDYIFLSPRYRQLSLAEAAQVLQHEQVHADQRHTWDLLLLGVAGIFFWFNPLFLYLKKALREVHEYAADSTVVREGTNPGNYAKLLIRLTAPETTVSLSNGFSGKQVTQRIIMLTQTPSTPMQKLKFMLALPLLALSLVFSAFIKQHTNGLPASGDMISQANIPANSSSNKAMLPAPKHIGKITWSGNTLYNSQTLNQVFGLKEGDAYQTEEVRNRLNYMPDGRDVTTLYVDKGYAFFSVELEEIPVDKQIVDLQLNIYEGPLVKLRNIVIHENGVNGTVRKFTLKGTHQAYAGKLSEQINLTSGELFNRSKLMQSQRVIAEDGYHDPDNIVIEALPVKVNGKSTNEIDILFNIQLKKKSNTPDEAIRLLFNGKEIDPQAGIPAHSTGYFSVEIPNEEAIKENGSKIGINFTLARGNRPVVKPEKKLSNYRDLSSTDMAEIFSLSKPGDRLVFELTGVKNHIIRVVPIK